MSGNVCRLSSYLLDPASFHSGWDDDALFFFRNKTPNAVRDSGQAGHVPLAVDHNIIVPYSCAVTTRCKASDSSIFIRLSGGVGRGHQPTTVVEP